MTAPGARRIVAAAITVALALTSSRPGAAGNGLLDCLIQPDLMVAISPAIEGLVKTVSVDRGDPVKEGDVIATLESSLEEATLAIARAKASAQADMKSNQVKVEFGDRRLTRTRAMFKKDLVPVKEMDEAETGKLLADTGLLEAQENKHLAQLTAAQTEVTLALKTVRSPITGVVTERLLSPGEFTRQQPIVKLARIDPLRVEVFAPVALIRQIRLGMRAIVSPEAPVGGEYVARVTVVDRVVDAASGTFGVRLELPNPGYKLPAGLKCKLRFLD